MIQKLKQWVKMLKREIYTIWFAARDEHTPNLLKILSFIIAAYAISPIDLIPDFIPILGYLDDLIVVPLGIWVLLKYLPSGVLIRSRMKAAELKDKPISINTAIVFVSLWIFMLYWIWVKWGDNGLMLIKF